MGTTVLVLALKLRRTQAEKEAIVRKAGLPILPPAEQALHFAVRIVELFERIDVQAEGYRTREEAILGIYATEDALELYRDAVSLIRQNPPPVVNHPSPGFDPNVTAMGSHLMD